jgi:hypothetical protein
MKTKQILIGAAIIGGAAFFYMKNKKKKDEVTDSTQEKPSSDMRKAKIDEQEVEPKIIDGKFLGKPIPRFRNKSDMEKWMAQQLKVSGTKPKRGIRPNERGTAISSSLSSAKAKAAAQSQVGVEIAEFAFNGHTF